MSDAWDTASAAAGTTLVNPVCLPSCQSCIMRNSCEYIWLIQVATGSRKLKLSDSEAKPQTPLPCLRAPGSPRALGGHAPAMAEAHGCDWSEDGAQRGCAEAQVWLRLKQGPEIYIHVHIYIYIYIRAHAHTHTHTHTHAHTHTHPPTHPPTPLPLSLSLCLSSSVSLSYAHPEISKPQSHPGPFPIRTRTSRRSCATWLD